MGLSVTSMRAFGFHLGSGHGNLNVARVPVVGIVRAQIRDLVHGQARLDVYRKKMRIPPQLKHREGVLL